MHKYIFFDLDGTLIQSEFGIFESARYALEKLGVESKDDDFMRKMIGPPLYVSFHDLYGMDDETSLEAVRLYREHYGKIGLYKSPLYEGIEEVLRNLKKNGALLAVVTGKPADLSVRILEHFKIYDLFETVVGPDRKSKDPKKVDLINHAIKALNINPEDHMNTVMVGDRCFDIEGAKEAGIRSAGVLYGYGSREELEKSGADIIIPTPQDIFRCLDQS